MEEQQDVWEVQGGKGIWTRWKNIITGQESYSETPVKVGAKVYCKSGDHYFVLESPRARTVECKHCGLGSKFIPGIYKLASGKLTKQEVMNVSEEIINEEVEEVESAEAPAEEAAAPEAEAAEEAPAEEEESAEAAE